MSDTIKHLNFVAEFGSFQAEFILRHGRPFDLDARTFKGRRMQRKNCFANAAKMVLHAPGLTYVEGYVSAVIPIHHAWVMRSDGSIVDPTLRIKGRIGNLPRDYFGVPFSSKFLIDFLIETGAYGLLDGMSERSIALMTGEVEPTEFLAANALEQAA